jgi:hypothetical protein
MPISNPLMPSVPDGLHVEDLTLDGKRRPDRTFMGGV